MSERISELLWPSYCLHVVCEKVEVSPLLETRSLWWLKHRPVNDGFFSEVETATVVLYVYVFCFSKLCDTV